MNQAKVSPQTIQKVTLSKTKGLMVWPQRVTYHSNRALWYIWGYLQNIIADICMFVCMYIAEGDIINYSIVWGERLIISQFSEPNKKKTNHKKKGQTDGKYSHTYGNKNKFKKTTKMCHVGCSSKNKDFGAGMCKNGFQKFRSTLSWGHILKRT